MRLEQLRWTGDGQWQTENSSLQTKDKPSLVLVFGSPNFIQDEAALESLRSQFPDAILVGGSTAGNVLSVSGTDSDIVATAVAFDHSHVRLTSVKIDDTSKIDEVAKGAVRELLAEDLRHILVLSDGLNINGSELVKGLNENAGVSVSGGLMGDNGAFEETFVIADGPPESHQIALVGFYGDQLTVNHGCFAGWEEFGINRVITRSQGNVVYEIDNQPALALYKKYLGEFAKELPGSGLRFPLSIRGDQGQMVIRTLLGIDEEAQSLTFAGDVPEGSSTLLMKGSTDNLIEGANEAAMQAKSDQVANDEQAGDSLAVIISCVGRRMVMDQMADEELDVISEVLGRNTRLTGFYSYGELAPLDKESLHCSLHNQTMTLITLSES